MNKELLIGIIVGSIIFLILLIVGIILICKKKKKNKIETIPTNNELAKKIIDSVGGKDNITNVSAKMTRLAIGVKTSDKFDSKLVPEIKSLIMETKITFLIGDNAEKIAKEIESEIK